MGYYRYCITFGIHIWHIGLSLVLERGIVRVSVKNTKQCFPLGDQQDQPFVNTFYTSNIYCRDIVFYRLHKQIMEIGGSKLKMQQVCDILSTITMSRCLTFWSLWIDLFYSKCIVMVVLISHYTVTVNWIITVRTK